METSKARRAALRKLLVMGQASTQGELRRMLAGRGPRAPQSAVGRGPKPHGAQRMQRDDGEQVYNLRARTAGGFPAEMVRGVEHNEAVVVVRTRVGRAQAVGLELDAAGVTGILGTLAGDDTV